MDPVLRQNPAEARRALGLPPDGLIVGFSGRLTPIKRPDRFLDVAMATSASRGDVTFAVAGDGELAEAVRRQAAPLGDRVRLLGWRQDVERFYAACDVIMCTSDNEGMPVALIEAATHGRPVVATAVGSVAEVVDDAVTGFVRPLDVPALTTGW